MSEDFEQIVILGAGNDSKFHRFHNIPQSIRLFEIDGIATQQAKAQILAKSLSFTNPNITLVSVDFERENWIDKLKDEGFQESKKTLVFWEGVVSYLTESSIRSTLNVISQWPNGSRIVLDYPISLNQGLQLQICLYLASKLGEPIKSMFCNDSMFQKLFQEYHFQSDTLSSISGLEVMKSAYGDKCLSYISQSQKQRIPIEIKLLSITLQK